MKLYVGNLSYSTTEQELSDMFAAFGTVISAKIIMDRDTQRSKGFGFVEMESKEESEKAIKELNGKEINGRAIIVNEARQREKRDNRRSFSKKRY
jgi:cold-inducible RNA-binding protein